MMSMTSDGAVNLYDCGRSSGTAVEKGMAARMGGHTWNPITGNGNHEIYFTGTRNPHHPFFLGDRKTKVPADARDLVGKSLRGPAPHPREAAGPQRRREVQLAQIENASSYHGFQERCGQMFPPHPRKRYSIEPSLYALETGKLQPRSSPKQEWIRRRGERMDRSVSCPSVDLRDPAGSLDAAVRADPRKRAGQLQSESDACLPRASASCSLGIDSTSVGRQLAAKQGYLSVHRVENGDFSVAKANNHYSGVDRSTKGDPFYQRPAVSATNNSVKYNIISNQRNWFKY